MDELLGVIFAALREASARARDRRAEATDALRAALVARGPVAAARAQPPVLSTRNPAGTPATVGVPLRPPTDPAGRPRSGSESSSGRARATPEGTLISGLFSSPRSLAAAFVAAEILAKPVALRDP